jgi:hypothetical protein
MWRSAGFIQARRRRRWRSPAASLSARGAGIPVPGINPLSLVSTTGQIVVGNDRFGADSCLSDI